MKITKMLLTLFIAALILAACGDAQEYVGLEERSKLGKERAAQAAEVESVLKSSVRDKFGSEIVEIRAYSVTEEITVSVNGLSNQITESEFASVVSLLGDRFISFPLEYADCSFGDITFFYRLAVDDDSEEGNLICTYKLAADDNGVGILIDSREELLGGHKSMKKLSPAEVYNYISGVSLNLECSELILDFKARIREEAEVLANICMYELEHWEICTDADFGLDFDQIVVLSTVELSNDRGSTISPDDVRSAYDDLIALCADIADAQEAGHISDDIDNTATALFGCYHALYALVTAPSGELEDFAAQANSHASAMTELNEELSALLSAD